MADARRARHRAPARSASRPRARSCTAPSTANRCPARSPPRTSCSASARSLGELGTGVFELAPAGVMGEDLAAPEREVDWMRRLSAAIGRPVTFALVAAQPRARPVARRPAPGAGGQRRGRRPPRPGGGPPARPAARLPDLPPVPGPAHLPEDRATCRWPSGWSSCGGPRCARPSSPRRRRPAPLDAVIGTGPRPHLPARRAARLRADARHEHRRHRRAASDATPRRCSTT